MTRACRITVVLAAALMPSLAAASVRGYYRMPSLRGNSVVFTSQGDLWVVSASGGLAHPLTEHPNTEYDAAISPDGSTVAFMASYDGPNEIYTMPISGGRPTRVSWASNELVRGWTSDGKILAITGVHVPTVRLETIDPRSGARAEFPVDEASNGCIGPNGVLYFTRYGFQGSHTKRYKGGTAQSIWRYAPGAAEAEDLTRSYIGTSKDPALWRGRIYFLSDRDGTMNIWSMDTNGHSLSQETHSDGWDIATMSMDDGRIAYQVGADIHILNVSTHADRALDITLASDNDQTRTRWITNPTSWITSAHVSPDGSHFVFTARGQVFVAPVGPGRLVRATHAGGQRWRSAVYLPDGKTVVALSNVSGETEWYRLPPNGVGEPVRITTDAHVTRMSGRPSPDGKLLAYTDRLNTLWLLHLDTGKSDLIAKPEYGGIGDYAWAPDSRWLAYTAATQTFDRINVYSVATAQSTPVTTARSDARSPAWSPDGHWLYFISDRTFNTEVGAPWGPREPEPFFENESAVYMIPLQKGQQWPFATRTELTAHPPAPAADAKPAATVKVAIDFDGIIARTLTVPSGTGNFQDLTAVANRLLWMSRPRGGQSALVALEVTNDKPSVKTIAEGVSTYELSLDGKHLGIQKGQAWSVVDATAGPGANLEANQANLAGWTFSIEPREEWREIFEEAWRLHRDYFYAPNMHGVDWPAMLKKYEPLVDRVQDRDELSDLLAQMVSEVSCLHTFIAGGDMRSGPDHVAIAGLGADTVRDATHGGFRVTRVYSGDPDYPSERSPLSAPDAGVTVGDVITQVNGVSCAGATQIEELLQNEVGHQVLLHVISGATGAARDVVISAVGGGREDELRYADWETGNRALVDGRSSDTIGYVHLRAMGGGDIDRWARDFYPVFNRSGLIIDVRHNNGGNIDSWILEKLLRRAWFYWQPRSGKPEWNMPYAFRGHIVVLCDAHTYSDGEAFSEGFKRLGLGKVIGTRTWGGEVWLSFDNRVVDGGIASAPEMGVFGPQGDWLIEGHGVDPDIVVDNLPHASFSGKDTQLDAAIDYLMQEIREHPVPVPTTPPYPDKAFHPRRP